MTQQHTKDSDCTVDPNTGCCTECGVGHDGECAGCGGHGYHEAGCTENPLLCQECERPLDIEPDLMNDDYTPTCNNTECAMYGQMQLPLDDDERSNGPKQRRTR